MDYDLSAAIGRPPDVVFATLADIQRYVQPGSPVPEMEKIPAGPTTVGTRWREVIRLGPFLTMVIWSEVTAIEPDRRLEERFDGPWITGRLVYSIEPGDGGCVLRQQQTITPHGPLRLAAGPMDRMFRPRITARLESIRDGLERDTLPPAGATAERRQRGRRLRWSLAVIAIVVEVGAFVAWRLWLRRVR
jgi:hypothetical protein